MKRRKREPAPPGCYTCKGTGRVLIEMRDNPGGSVLERTTAMDFCTCRLGIWLIQQERKRKEARPTG